MSELWPWGGGTQLRGLLKYLQQSLQIPVERPDMFKRLALAQGTSAAKFHDSVAGFGVVYGLAIQVLGFGRIQSNLLPKSIARSQAWAMKIRMFMGAACFLLLVSAMALGRVIVDNMAYSGKADIRARVNSTISQANSASSALSDEQSKGDQHRDEMKKVLSLFTYRDTIPWIYETLVNAMPNAQNNPAQKALYDAFEARDFESVKATARRDRKQMFVTRMQVSFAEDLDIADFDIINLGQGPVGAVDDPLNSDPRMELYRLQMQDMSMGGTTVEKSAGFVVVMEGYSPYQDISQLLDPSGVDNEPDRWGFVTRMMHLSDKEDPNDPNKPLALYKKETDTHFVLKKGAVSSADKDMPYGIGVPEDEDADMFGMGMSTNEDVTLLDPLTKEVISSYPKKDGMGREMINRLSKEPVMVINDNWFVLKFKLKWHDAPKLEEGDSPGGGAMGVTDYMGPR